MTAFVEELFSYLIHYLYFQNQPSRSVLRKRCSKNMHQIYRRTTMPKCDFSKVTIEITLWHGCSPINLMHIFRTPFFKNTTGRLLLYFALTLIENQQYLTLHKKSPYSELFWSTFFPDYSVSLHIQSECGKIRKKRGRE